MESLRFILVPNSCVWDFNITVPDNGSKALLEISGSLPLQETCELRNGTQGLTVVTWHLLWSFQNPLNYLAIHDLRSCTSSITIRSIIGSAGYHMGHLWCV